MTDRGRAWAIFWSMSAMYCFSMFYRVSTALIAVDLAREFALGPERLSLLGGAFFYAFAFAQLPLGPALDRFGAKRIVVGATILGACGSLIFAASHGWWGLLLGRALMGLGMAPVLMGSLKLFADWFQPGSFGTLSGLIMSIGGFGSLLAATPLALLVSRLGWRRTFVLFGLLTLLSTCVVHWIVRDRRSPSPGNPARPGSSSIGGLKSVFRRGSFWGMAPLALVGYASIASLQGLWAGPFFMESLGYSREQTGNVLLGLGFAGAAGPVLAGYLSDRIWKTRKWVILGGTVPTALLMIPLLGVGAPSTAAGWAALFTALGFVSSGRTLIYAHAKESLPPELAGTAVATINFFIMIGPALLQQAMGLALSVYPGDFAKAFLIPIVALSAGCLAYLFTRDTHPGRG